jgi:hypothetical protein
MLRKETAMNTQQRNGAEAWPISREGYGHRPILEQVVIESKHPEGQGIVRLTPDQALYAQSRLSLVAMAYLHGHNGQVHRFGIDHLPDDHEDKLSRCGAKVWPIGREEEGKPAVLEWVVIESEHPQGHGMVFLSPDQARYIQGRLSSITLAFLHENVWSGEDARVQ